VAKKEEKPKVDMRQQEMIRLNDQLDVYTRKIEVEQRKVAELNAQVEPCRCHVCPTLCNTRRRQPRMVRPGFGKYGWEGS